MADEAILRVRIEEGAAGPTRANTAAPAGAGRQSVGGGSGGFQGETGDLFRILKLFLGGGLLGALTRLVEEILNANRDGSRASGGSRAAQISGSLTGQGMRAERITIQSPRTGIVTEQLFVTARTAVINAPGAIIRVTDVSARTARRPPAGKASRPPRQRPPGGGGALEPYRYPSPVPQTRYPPPGQRGQPVFYYPTDALVPSMARVQAHVIPPRYPPPAVSPPAAAAATSAPQTLLQTTLSFAKLGAVAGAYVGVVLASAAAFRRLIRSIDETVDRYAAVNAPIALAQARAEITNLMGDIRRGQRIAPELVQYIEARTALQQKYEDIKIDFINKVLPLVTTAIDILTGILKTVTISAEIAVAAGGLLIPDVLKEKFNTLVVLLRAIIAAIARNNPEEISDFTSLILGNIPAQHFFQGGDNP